MPRAEDDRRSLFKHMIAGFEFSVYPFPRLVAFKRLKSLVYPTILFKAGDWLQEEEKDLCFSQDSK